MTGAPGSRSFATRRTQLLLLLALPLAVLLAFRVAAWLPSAAPADRASLTAAFEELLEDTRVLAEDALLADDPEAGREALRSVVARRVEGVGLLDSDLTFRRWWGSPVEPELDFAKPQAPTWRIRRDGVRTRLVVRGGPDARGRLSIVSLVLASSVEPLTFEELLPARNRRGLHLQARFWDTASQPTEIVLPEAATPAAEDRNDGEVPLSSPAGVVMAMATVRAQPPERQAARIRETGDAVAAVLFALLLAGLVRWRDLSENTGGYLAALGLVWLARTVLLLADADGILLPSELSGAGFFGSSGAGGLISSPADLLLTGIALYACCLLTRQHVFLCAPGRPVIGSALGLVTGALVTIASLALVIPLARDTRLPILAQRAILGEDPRPLLLVGFVLVLLGAAECWGAGYTVLRGRRPTSVLADRLPVVIALTALSVAATATLRWQETKLSLERLGTEFAPLVLEQASRRQVALVDAVQHIRDSYADHEHPMELSRFRPEYLAFQYWVSSALFSGGYRSSLDFYNPRGDLLSHFGFGLPLILDLDPELPAYDVFEEQTEPQGDYVQELTHAQTPVERNGQLLGVVVGHVLDEPTNLPFLPRSRPYLAALGAGMPRLPDAAAGGEPQYVLYDEYGRAVVSTLRQPPADTPALRLAAGSSDAVRVEAAGESWIGLALADRRRLHLLLLPAGRALERLTAAVRLGILGLAVMLLVQLTPRIVRPHTMLPLLRRLRHSFYRKLLTALLIASVVPLLGLSLLLKSYIESRGEAELANAATRSLATARRVLEDYDALLRDEQPSASLDDNILFWLGSLIEQEISVYHDGRLQASSMRELYASGLLPPRLDGEVQRQLIDERQPSLVRQMQMGSITLPVAYTMLRGANLHPERIVAVPIVLEQTEIAAATDRVVEVILLSTVLLVGLLALAAAFFARTVARPVRDLVEATEKIAAGDYQTRVVPRAEDEVGELVTGFNSMATALARQRADLEHRREYMERLLRHATTGVISTDPDGVVVTLNPAAHALLAAAGASLRIGADLPGTLTAIPELEPLGRALAAPHHGQTDPRDVDLEGPAGPRRFRFVRIGLTEPTGRVSGWLILLDDVTELMRSNQLAAWAEMARAIAHEIKNPLTPIQLSTEHLRHLLQDSGALPSEDVETCLATVSKQVQTLREIAGEFSTFARLPELAPETLDPVELMREVIAPYVSAKSRDVIIEERYEPTCAVSADRRVLGRALVNVVENALEAMPDGGTLTVSVTPAPEDHQVLLAIRDTGKGIEPEIHRRLFEPYFSTKSSGTGLGLAIVRRAIEAHRGTIEVDTVVESGTTVRILLPTLTH